MQFQNKAKEYYNIALVVQNPTLYSPVELDQLAYRRLLTREHILDSVNRRLAENHVDRHLMAIDCICEPYDGTKSLGRFQALVTLPIELKGVADFFFKDLNVNKVLFSASDYEEPIDEGFAIPPIGVAPREDPRLQDTYKIVLQPKFHVNLQSKFQDLRSEEILERINEYLKLNGLLSNQFALQCNFDFKRNSTEIVLPGGLDREMAMNVLHLGLCLYGVEFNPILIEEPVDNGRNYRTKLEHIDNSHVGGGKQEGLDRRNNAEADNFNSSLIIKCIKISPIASRREFSSNELLAAIKRTLSDYIGERDIVDIRINPFSLTKVNDWVKVIFPTQDIRNVAEAFLNCEILPGIEVMVEKSMPVAPAPKAAAAIENSRPRDQKVEINESKYQAAGLKGERYNYRGRQMYLFCDMSNITCKGSFIGDPRLFMETIACGGDNFQYKYACGSMPAYFSAEKKWKIDEPAWQSFIQSKRAEEVTGPANTWKIDVQPRLRSLGEFNVDESLCAHVYKNVLDNINKNGVILFISGDGANDRGCVSIQQTIEHILSLEIFKSWTVHLWTWRGSCNRRYFNYADYHKHPDLRDRFHLSFFDDYPKIFVTELSAASKEVIVNRKSASPNRKINDRIVIDVPKPASPDRKSKAQNKFGGNKFSERSPSPEVKPPDAEFVFENAWITEDNDIEADGVLQLKKGNLVQIEQLAIDDHWSIVIDEHGNRGYCKTSSICRIPK